MTSSKREHFDRLVGMSITLCLLTVFLSVIIASIAALYGEFLASWVCLIPASLSPASYLSILFDKTGLGYGRACWLWNAGFLTRCRRCLAKLWCWNSMEDSEIGARILWTSSTREGRNFFNYRLTKNAKFSIVTIGSHAHGAKHSSSAAQGGWRSYSR